MLVRLADPALPVQHLGVAAADGVDAALPASKRSCRYTVAMPMRSPAAGTAAWISCALRKPGSVGTTAATALACLVERTVTVRGSGIRTP
jgi:hypothetical protein